MMYAARRMLTLVSVLSLVTLRKASTMYLSSFCAISSSSHCRLLMFCVHSKKLPTTPPPFASKSGSTGIPRCCSTASPEGAIAPLPASTTALQFTLAAVAGVMVLATAAATSTSHGISRKLVSLGMAVPPGKLASKFDSLANTWLLRAVMSSPFSLKMAVSELQTPITLPPASCRYWAAQEPSLPKPWMMNVEPWTRDDMTFRMNSRVAMETPRPAAESLP
mmetsp:Transcript_25248/g.54873  ORF Transcript_25248/g.54873 Transcript_25248/m.54873 type:complete len:221 (-) Transcript_25248:716-1378(-)